jgi:hypothetical protein
VDRRIINFPRQRHLRQSYRSIFLNAGISIAAGSTIDRWDIRFSLQMCERTGLYGVAFRARYQPRKYRYANATIRGPNNPSDSFK